LKTKWFFLCQNDTLGFWGPKKPFYRVDMDFYFKEN
jgi:hypothetical protein